MPMTILNFDIRHVRLPFKTPWKTAYGEETHLETVLVKAACDDAEAWVETCPLASPEYLSATAATAAATMADILAPAVIGVEFDTPAALAMALAEYPGDNFARSGIELCAWALESVRAQVPLRQLLGAPERSVLRGFSVGMKESVDAVLVAVNAGIDAGCAPVVKLKIAPGFDAEVVTAVRAAFPTLALRVDANGAYARFDDPVFRSLAAAGLDMIEQPLPADDLAGHAALRKAIQTPICLDESICSVDDMARALRLDACGAVSIKIGRVGGLVSALEILQMCRDDGIDCYVGGMFESGVGAAINLAFAALVGQGPHEITLPDRVHAAVFTDPGICMGDGGLVAPTAGTYIGQTVNEARVEEMTVRQWQVVGT